MMAWWIEHALATFHERYHVPYGLYHFGCAKCELLTGGDMKGPRKPVKRTPAEAAAADDKARVGGEVQTTFHTGGGRTLTAITCATCAGKGCVTCKGWGFHVSGQEELGV